MLRVLITLLLLIISSSSYGKERSTLKEALPEPNNLVCTQAHHEDCLTLAGRLETLEVERVVDGDTLVASGRKIRVWGINAPEKGKPYYHVATMFLEAVLKNGELQCKSLYKDRYNRDVMHCWVDKADLGALIVEAGLAIDYEKYSGGFYYYEERLAKLKRRGMWKNTKYKIGE